MEQYDAYDLQRLAVTPGLTCYWQVYPERHEISFDDWVALDIKYIEEKSWKVDLKLIWQTIALVFKAPHD